jgi:hypothetical protein
MDQLLVVTATCSKQSHAHKIDQTVLICLICFIKKLIPATNF